MQDKTTGLTVILPQRKQRYILTYPGTMFEMTGKDLDLGYVLSAKHLHVSSYFLQKGMRASLVDVFRRAKEAGLTTSLDTNDDPENRWSTEIHLLLKYTDILLPNEREACKLAHTEKVEQAAEILSQKVPILAIKRGSQGTIARASKESYVAFPPVVDVVDHVGAGDSFDAGFVHKFIRGAKVEQCLRFGNIVGSLCVTRPGGTEAFRDVRHREDFLRKHAVTGGSHSPSSAIR
jgi:sugar/nucleoside kinase (ribokinase family)